MKTIKEGEVHSFGEAQWQSGIKETQFIIKNTSILKEKGTTRGGKHNLRKGEMVVTNIVEVTVAPDGGS